MWEIQFFLHTLVIRYYILCTSLENSSYIQLKLFTFSFDVAYSAFKLRLLAVLLTFIAIKTANFRLCVHSASRKAFMNIMKSCEWR